MVGRTLGNNKTHIRKERLYNYNYYNCGFFTVPLTTMLWGVLVGDLAGYREHLRQDNKNPSKSKTIVL